MASLRQRAWARLAVLAISLFAVIPVSAAGQDDVSKKGRIEEEHLMYDIIYQWGILWKRAAVGTLSVVPDGENYRAVMTASTLPFADALFKVRDTLVSEMRAVDLRPLSFTKIVREGKFYQIDKVAYKYRNDSTVGRTVLARPGKDFLEEIQLSVKGAAYDMLSVFYRVRRVPFAQMQPGEIFRTPIFSGRNIEWLDIEYIGVKTVEVRKEERPAYYLRFRFYDLSGKKTSDKISAWISMDTYVPLRLEGKLPVGTMKVVLKEQR